MRLDIDYQNLQGNFEQANVVYGTDHYPFDNATSNQGFHNKATFPVRADPTSVASQGIIYTKDSANMPGRADPYYAYQTAAATSMTGTFCPLLAVKAFGKADLSGLVSGTSFNVTSAARVGDVWTIVITSAFVTAPNAQKMMVIAVPESASTTNVPSLGIQITNETTITVRRTSTGGGGAGGVSVFSFMILAV